MSPVLIGAVVVAVVGLIVGQKQLDKRKVILARPTGPRRDAAPPKVTSADGHDLVESVLAAADTAHALWPADDVQKAQSDLAQVYGAVPTLGDLREWYGLDTTERVVREEAEWRRTLLDGLGQLNAIPIRPGICQVCGRPATAAYPFGLARVRRVEREWGAVLGSAVASLVLGSIIGFGIIYGPGKRQSGNLLGLKLELCPECARAIAGRLHLGKPKVEHYSAHPWWAVAHACGFTTFVAQSELRRWQPMRT